MALDKYNIYLNHANNSIHFSSKRFFKMLGSDEMRAWYGPDHVSLAADRGAIGTLLISDDLFR
jgi:stalled ribosome rescue protein Dom34